MKFLNAAINLHAGGLNLVPLTKELMPTIKWSIFKTEKQTEKDIKNLFSKKSVSAIAIICGEISGHVEMIDVDTKNSPDPEFGDKVIDKLKKELPDVINQVVIEETKSGGYHFYYRCPSVKIPGNHDIAERHTTKKEKEDKYKETLEKTGNKVAAKTAAANHKTKTLIETRGEGGFSYCQPTTGYRVVQGDLQEIPIIESWQRDHLHGILRLFDEVDKPVDEISPKHKTEGFSVFKETPWDVYNKEGDPIGEMLNHGWEITKEDDEKIYLKRPGTDNVQSGNFHKAKNLLYVFSTNTEFPAEKGIPPFQIYAYLNHQGDTAKTTHDLLEKGYGEKFSDKELEAKDYASGLLSEGKDIEQVEKALRREFGDVPGQVDTKTVVKAAKVEVARRKKKGAGPFWDVNDKNEVAISDYKLLKYCVEELGYRKYYTNSDNNDYVLVQLDYKGKSIKQVKPEEIINELQALIFKWENAKAFKVHFDKLSDALLKKKNLVNSGSAWFNYFLTLEEVEDASSFEMSIVRKNKRLVEVFSFYKSSKKESLAFFRNGVVSITPDGVSLKGYDSIPSNHYIWEEKKRDIDIDIRSLSKDMISNSKWFKFLRRISGIDENYDHLGSDTDSNDLTDEQKKRWLSTMSITGFLCHDYKDKEFQVAIVCQEDTDDQEHGGGTGKGLYFDGLEQLRNREMIPGKTFDTKKEFCYQRVKLDTDIIDIQDVTRNIDPESIYNIVTDGITIRRLYSPEIFLPFNKSPKVAVTTNHILNGSGDHFERRFKFLLFARHFNKNHNPYHELGELFGVEWPEEQWQLFYNIMFECIRIHLKKGIVDVKTTVNVKIKTLKTKYGDLFAEWIASWYERNANKTGEVFEFINLHNVYAEETGSRLGTYKFNNGVEEYFRLFDIEYEECRSGSGRKSFQILTQAAINVTELPF